MVKFFKKYGKGFVWLVAGLIIVSLFVIFTVRLIDTTIELETTTNNFRELQSKQDSLVRQNSELLAIKDSIECDITQDISYESTSSASDSLKLYVGNISGNVVKSEWDSIWSSGKSSIHKLNTSEFLTVFIVYFDEFGFQEGTWFVDRQCWVDLK